jgi:hypothetical protein
MPCASGAASARLRPRHQPLGQAEVAVLRLHVERAAPKGGLPAVPGFTLARARLDARTDGLAGAPKRFPSGLVWCMRRGASSVRRRNSGTARVGLPLFGRRAIARDGPGAIRINSARARLSNEVWRKQARRTSRPPGQPHNCLEWDWHSLSHTCTRSSDFVWTEGPVTPETAIRSSARGCRSPSRAGCRPSRAHRFGGR